MSSLEIAKDLSIVDHFLRLSLFVPLFFFLFLSPCLESVSLSLACHGFHQMKLLQQHNRCMHCWSEVKKGRLVWPQLGGSPNAGVAARDGLRQKLCSNAGQQPFFMEILGAIMFSTTSTLRHYPPSVTKASGSSISFFMQKRQILPVDPSLRNFILRWRSWIHNRGEKSFPTVKNANLTLPHFTSSANRDSE